jgi:predicted AAA+ superfamily ATPase
MLKRQFYLSDISAALKDYPIVALLGPRQCGKSTLAREIVKLQGQTTSQAQIFDLEDDQDLARLAEPKLALEHLKGTIVIDEIQRLPNLFPTLRVLADRRPRPARFLILGSASRELIKQSSESLAGRIKYMEIAPFSLSEIESADPSIGQARLWLRGGFPGSLLSASDEQSWDWRKQYIRTYLEQDIPNLGIQIPAAHLRRFWMMISHYHGQIFNASELGKSLDISDHTAKRYLDILSGTFMVRQLQPWIQNIKKRQVKRPKIYLRDSGIFHFLQGIHTAEDLETNPKLGASWEGFAIEQVIAFYAADAEEVFFWGIHGTAELDLLIVKDGKRLGFEIKYTKTPKITSSMKHALEILKLDEISIVYAGDVPVNLAKNILARPLKAFLKGED